MEIGAAEAGIAQRPKAKQLTAAISQCFISMVCFPFCLRKCTFRHKQFEQS